MPGKIREIAIEKGDAKNRLPDPSYCSRCGIPVAAGTQHAHYEDAAATAKPNVPVRNPSPFKLGG